MKAVGFAKEVEEVKMGLCPFCKKEIILSDFKNELSKREFKISGICQSCQDEFFR